MSRIGTAVAVAAVTAGVLALTAAPALAQVEPYGYDNYGSFWNILPPGEGGLDNLTGLADFEALHEYPPYMNDQYSMYENLLWGAPTLTDATIPDYFVNATFGVKSGDATSQATPEPGATIVRDQHGIPHIYGDTRAELMFGAGYAAAQDRLFAMDALRHLGRGDLAQFAGGSNVNNDAEQWAVAPYTEADLGQQINQLQASGPQGAQVVQDGENYIDGINAYIAAAKVNPLLMPAEYAALGMPSGPAPFVPADLVSIASVIGGIFGIGGGDELQWTMLLQDLQRHMGKKAGYQAFLDFHSINDPATPTTVHGVRFPYDTVPSKVASGSEAIPDPGSVVSTPLQVLVQKAVDGGQARRTVKTALQVASAGRREGNLFPMGDSNALLVSARDSASGHPLAVMGPQVGYFSPEILMEEDLHGPGIDADGAAFPGVSQYVELGHGPDYAWSATSGYEGVITTFAVPLCNPAGGAVSISSDYYELYGKCLAMDVLQRTESWAPNLADPTPAGTQTLTAYRTEVGLVEARATINGKPVAYVQDRSTYMHELDSAIGFMMFDEPAEMTDPVAFQHAASHIGYAFNWFYIDSKHIAYFNSGLLPVRAPHTNPLYPTWAKFGWVGFNPAENTADYVPASQHPQVIDQDYLTSWNNKEAPGYSGADDLTNYSSVYRSQLLDAGIRADLAHGHKMTLAQLIQVMENAGTQDLRGVEVLPYLLKVIGSSSNPAVASAASQLRAWMDAGAHRFSPSDGAPYEYGRAIQIMDAWWPLLVKGIYEQAVGSAAFAQLEDVDDTDNPPNDEGNSPGGEGELHAGSAWDVGFYGTVQTDLEDVLGLHPAGALNRRYCGDGKLTACRAELDSTLAEAAAEPATEVYPGDKYCQAGKQVCWDTIQFRVLGAISQPAMQWVNRPTFQQAVEIQGHRPFPAESACVYAEYATVSTTRTSYRGGELAVAGRARPRDCGAGLAAVQTVKLSVGRRVSRGRCQFLTSAGRLSAGRACSNAIWLTARGGRRWSLRRHVSLPAGGYTIAVELTDRSGTTATGAARRLKVG